jgi:pSer/pThr/pTyr-binding forkhead associated (FHA) protein
MNARHLARFEETIRRLVEGTFARLFAGRLAPLEVANALAQAMEDQAVPRSSGPPLAPNHYWVTLNAADYDTILERQPNLAKDLTQHLLELAREGGFDLPAPPNVHLGASSDLPLRQIHVEARWLSDSDPGEVKDQDATQEMVLPARRSTREHQVPPSRPFLILEGRRHIPLLEATVSLGRSLDNDIIVDDARVSRHHAQLRQRYDRYVVYDLGSTGGVTVNGYPVQECVLEAGDVISLAGVEIIYGEDVPTPTPPTRGTSETPALRRSSGTEKLPPARQPDSET